MNMNRFIPGEPPPVAPGKPKLGWEPPVKEHVDYVPPTIGPLGTVALQAGVGVKKNYDTLLEAHKFIAVNAMYPSDRALADKIKDIISR